MSNDPNVIPPVPTPPAPPPMQGPPPGYPARPQHLADAHSKKILCGLMAIFLGNLGIHKFLLGYTGAGVITLLLNCTGIGIPVMRIITIIEGILYLTKTDEDFYNTYIANQKQWF